MKASTLTALDLLQYLQLVHSLWND